MGSKPGAGVGRRLFAVVAWAPVLALTPGPVTAQESPDAADPQALVAAYRDGRLTSATALAAAAEALIDLGRDDPPLFHDALAAYDRAVALDPENPDLRVALGDLFLSKYNGLDARETYEQALAIDPDHPGALLGLARVRRFDGATDVFELTARVLEGDPDHAGARRLQARQYLDLEDYAAADRQAERALAAARRRSDGAEAAQAHALLAASALLAGDAERTGRRLERLEQVAAAPEAFLTLAEAATRNRLYPRAVEFAGRALELDSRSWRAWAHRGINRLRTGEIAAGRADLERAFAGDPFDVWTKNTLDLLDAMDGYPVIETRRFQLVMPPGEAELLVLYLEPLAEEAFDRLAAHYGVAPPAPIRLEVFPRHADFSVRTVGLAGLGALGVCFGPVLAMNAPSAMDAGEIHWGTVLWHELAHTFHMRLSAGRVPRWFTEGLAVFEERRAKQGWGDRVGPDFLIAYQTGRLAPIEDLNQGFMRPSYPRQVAFSYLQASLLFDFIVERWGFDAVVAMLAGYRDGESTPEVVSAALGVDLEGLAEGYDAHFRRRFAGPLAAVRPPQDGDTSGLEAMKRRAEGDPADFLAHLAVGRGLLETDAEAAVTHLERARDLFPESAAGDSPYWWLAEAHRRTGRLERAAAELTALVARGAGHYPALRALAEVRAELSDPAGAAEALAAAQYVYPYEADDHRRLAEHFEAVGRTADAVRARRAVLALEPFDRARALYHLARAQLAAGDRKAARSAVLEALERAPSYGEALELLLEIRADR